MFSAYNIYQQPAWMIFALLVIAAWTLIWNGLGLWQAAKNKQKVWFIVILVLNTIGLLPIIYLIWFKPREANNRKEANNQKTTLINRRVTKRTIKKKEP